MIDVAEVYVRLADLVSELRRADRSNDGYLHRVTRDCYVCKQDVVVGAGFDREEGEKCNEIRKSVNLCLVG